jgi:hypothetical protein
MDRVMGVGCTRVRYGGVYVLTACSVSFPLVSYLSYEEHWTLSSVRIPAQPKSYVGLTCRRWGCSGNTPNKRAGTLATCHVFVGASDLDHILQHVYVIVIHLGQPSLRYLV